MTVGGEQLHALPRHGYDQWFRMFLPGSGGETGFELPAKLDMVGYVRYLRMPKATRPPMRNDAARRASRTSRSRTPTTSRTSTPRARSTSGGTSVHRGHVPGSVALAEMTAGAVPAGPLSGYVVGERKPATTARKRLTGENGVPEANVTCQAYRRQS